VIAPEDYAATREALAAAIAAIPGPDGAPLATQVYRPDAIYTQVHGVAPDLLVYFGDLHWRSVGSLGHGVFHTFDNDTGPDDANHSAEGLYILHDPRGRGGGLSQRRQLMDIAPTILRALGVAIPPDMQGTSLLE
jgi:predicted AlkP superfamily phosphohydrolase/phosphomutase